MRWAHVEHYDDFLPFLHFEEFDADDWTSLARDAGAGYAVMTAKHHDGWCWWDAPATERTVLSGGPSRNVFAEFAAACERADIVFGATYSLLDWADSRYPGTAYVSEVLHPHVRDLVDRYGVSLLWGDAHWGAGGDHWRSDELLANARAGNPDLVTNDRWWSQYADVAAREQHTMPPGFEPVPFEFRRPLGTSGSYNRAEPAELWLSAKAIVGALTEAVAKGGHLMLRVGPDASGRIPDAHAERLRAAGGWIRRHQHLIDRGEPWAVWGDAECRFLTVDDALMAVDVSGQGRFRALTPERGRVLGVSTSEGAEVQFDQDDRGVRLARPPRKAQRLPAVYRIELAPTPPAPIELFPSAPPEPIELGPLTDGAIPGSIVQLGDGVYRGPAHVGPGVTLRGLGADRTTVDASASSAITVDAGARLAHCRVTGRPRIGRLPATCVELVGEGAATLGCTIDGHVAVTAGDCRLTSCTLTGVVADQVDHLEVARCQFVGMGSDTGVEITGGAGHVVDSCELEGHLTAISVTSAVGATIARNRLHPRWWGVRLVDTDSVEVTGNAVERTMRSIDVDGGTDARVTGNAASDGDSGCVVQRGATHTVVAGNYWERCRVGLLVWDAGDVRDRDNTTNDLGDPDAARLVGP